jgi:cytochrome bd-type quinol oxidase subunit 1
MDRRVRACLNKVCACVREVLECKFCFLGWFECNKGVKQWTITGVKKDTQSNSSRGASVVSLQIVYLLICFVLCLYFFHGFMSTSLALPAILPFVRRVC